MEKTAKIVKNKGGQFITAHGRRKQAVARVRLYKGRGEITVNDEPINEYFPRLVDQIKWQRPFTVTKSDGTKQLFEEEKLVNSLQRPPPGFGRRGF